MSEQGVKPLEPQEVAACGFGYQGQCCCECSLLLRDKPSCDHTGAKRNNLCPEVSDRFVCLVFADEGIALTKASPHGACECWTARTQGGDS